MKRMSVVVAIATAAVLGLVGCSSGGDSAEETTVEQTTSTVEETTAETTNETAGDDATGVDASACAALQEPLQQASESMNAIAEEAQNDPQAAVDMWRELAVAFEEFGESSTDPELAAQSAEVGEKAHVLTDAMEKVYVNQDMAALTEVTEAQSEFFDAYNELLSNCTPA